MVRHVVCFKLNDVRDKSEAVKVLRSMDGKIPYMKAIEVGENFLVSERAYDIILITTFENKEDIERYQKDEYHCNTVKKFMHAHVEKSIAIDWEVE